MKITIGNRRVFIGNTSLAELEYWLAYMADFHGERYYGPLRDIIEALREIEDARPSGTFKTL